MEESVMRKKLVVLAFALAAAAAGIDTPASAAGPACPINTYPINCGTYTLCCRIGARCICGFP
jgi:hypothetical protein